MNANSCPVTSHSDSCRLARAARGRALAVALAAMAPLASLCLPPPAAAQSLSIASGAAGNTYDVLVQQFAKACQNDVGVPIVSLGTGGSMDNIDLLLNNEATAGVVQADVLVYRARLDDLSSLKALFALNPEEVHLLALTEARSEGGFAGIGTHAVALNSLADLRGRSVGSWGGSAITANVLRLQSEVGFKVVEFADQVSALDALTRRKVDAILSVGGSPQPWLQKLDRRYKLVPIVEAEAAALKQVYRPARLSYGNLGQSGVQTVATDAVLITRQFRTPAMVSMLSRARRCFHSRLVELQETPGNHAKWQAVEVDRATRWPMLELPAGDAAALAAHRLPPRQALAK